MKRNLIFLLTVLLVLMLSCTAMAEYAGGMGSISVQTDGLSTYIDGSGGLLIPGNPHPINRHPADSIISIDSYRLIFLSKSTDEANGERTSLVSVDLLTFEETVLSENVHAACSDGSDKLYFISADDRTQLYLNNFENNTTSVVHTSAEALDRLYVSAEGLVVTYVEDAGAVIYVAATDSFEPYGFPIPRKSVMTDTYQIYIDNDDVLYIHRPGSLSADAIDMNVFDFAHLNGKVYYLANTGSALRIKVYDPELLEQKVVITPDIALSTQLTASRNSLFVLGYDRSIYRVNIDSGILEPFATIVSPAAIEACSIEAVSGMLNIYANEAGTDQKSDFTFMEYTSDAMNDTIRPVLIQSIPLEDEEDTWSILQPAPQFTPLRRGNRGDSVSTIQQPLYEHNYYDYYIDGIFGYRTDNAVRLLQEDLGYPVNGIADENLQRLIISGNFPNYDPYLPLNRGDKGLRVTRLQQRLRNLGYLADGADGIFGGRTQAAVQLFQRENNLPVSDSASRETLTTLYKASTARCSGYIDLMQGDSGYRVRELNKRLKELFYLEGGVLDSYTAATAEAVRRFRAQVDLPIDDSASAELQQRLFAPETPECTGYSELRRGDENTRVSRLQSRLKELNYFTGNITGYYGKQTQVAVNMFQKKTGMRPTGIASIPMQELLFSPDAPIYVNPTILSTPEISIDCYDKRDGGIYYLSDKSSEKGYITFTWAAEGNVGSYNVTIADDLGSVHVDQNTDLTMIRVPFEALTLNQVYTLNVTAYPEDGDSAQATHAKLSFCRTEVPAESVEIGKITGVYTSIDTVSHTENDIHYVQPGTITFRWYAEGDVSSYYVEIRDSRNKVLLKAGTGDEFASTKTDHMIEGEVYTLCVYAIPVNGDIDHATLKTQAFALDTHSEVATGEENRPLPPVELGAPEIVIDPIDEIVNSIVYVKEGTVHFSWFCEGASGYLVELIHPAGNVLVSTTTSETSNSLNSESIVPEAIYTIRVTGISADGAGSVSEVCFSRRSVQEETSSVTVESDSQENSEEPAIASTLAPADESTPVPTEESEPYQTPTAEIPSEADSILPDAWNTPLDAADSVRVNALQQRLQELGWLLPDTYAVGVLDDATFMAVLNFQLNYNAAISDTLIPITAETTAIDTDTLYAIMLEEF